MTDFIVDPIVDFATNFIDAVGLLGVFVLMLLESACIPVPSEAIMLFAGFNVSEGDLTLFGIVAAGVPATSSAPGSPGPPATTAGSSCSRRTG